MKRNSFILETERLILSDLLKSQLEDIYKLGSDSAITKYLDYIRFDNIDSAEKWLTEAIDFNNQIPRRSYNLSIIHKTEGYCIGWIGIGESSQDSNIWDFGVAISKESQGKGYATEALKTLIDYCFSNLNITMITGDCDAQNLPSVKVMQKIGMKFVKTEIKEGKIQNYFVIHSI